MADKIHFTVDRIKGIPPAPSAKRIVYHDDVCSGLCLRVTSSGTKTFFLMRKVRRRARKITLGHFDENGAGINVEEARRRARIVAGKIESGYDPQVERNARRNIPTLGDYFTRWMEQHGKVDVAEDTWKQKQGVFWKHCDGLATCRLDEITKEKTRVLLVGIKERLSPRTANFVRGILNQVYRQAIEDRVLPPGFEIPLHAKFKEPRGRTRFVRPDEWPRLVKALQEYGGALGNEPETVRAFVLMAMFTGQRRGNVLSMRWDEIDWENRVWVIHAEKTKTSRDYTILLAPPAHAVLSAQHRRWGHRSEWVFPNPLDPAQPVKNPKRAWDTIRKAAGLDDLRFHDLRHTYGTYQFLATGNMKLLQLNMQHSEMKTTSEVYTHLDTDERLREAASAGCKEMSQAAGVSLAKLVETDFEEIAGEGGVHVRRTG